MAFKRRNFVHTCRVASIATITLASVLQAFAPAMAAERHVSLTLAAIAPKHADFSGETVTRDVRHIADWALDSGDHENLPFVVIDKKRARVYVFSSAGQLVGAAPILLGRALGDEFSAGVADMDMQETNAWQRITPAGRYRAEEYRKPSGEHILWVDYDSAIALHKVLLTNAGEERGPRIEADDPDLRRITFGCINVPTAFYDRVVHPAFRRSDGIVYILPEIRPVQAVFNSYEVPGGAPLITKNAFLASINERGAAGRASAPRDRSPVDRRSSGMKFLPPQVRRSDSFTSMSPEADS